MKHQMKRGGEDDEEDKKITGGHMFPRLHVNDTDKKGGPRPPPRNKMALYEHLTLPSHRFKPGRPLTPSSTQSSIPETRSTSQYPVPQPLHPHWGQNFVARQSDALTLDAPSQRIHQRNKANDDDDDDDFTVPVFISSIPRPCSFTTKYGADGVKHRAFPLPVQHANDGTTCKASLTTSFRKDVTHPNEETGTGHHSLKRDQFKYTPDLATTNKMGRASKEEKVSDKKDHGSDSSSQFSRSRDMDACLRQDSKSAKMTGDNGSINGAGSVRCTDIRAFPQQEADIYPQKLGSTPYEPDANMERLGDEVDGAEPFENSDDVSETSMVDSVSGLDISPDDVVAIIGQKLFWKARRAIVNQQRVFAVQVFELHRLIKVQKLIAEFPDFLVEDSEYLVKDSFKAPPAKKLQREYLVKPLAQIKGGEESERPSYTVGKTTLSTTQNGSQSSGYGPYGGTLASALVGNEIKANGWSSFHQSPGHQWLIPVMSPSEGLVFKPYYPPGPGFLGNVCGAPFGSYNMSSGYGVLPAPGPPPPQYQVPQAGQTYFPSYGVNPAHSASAVDQMPPASGGVIQHQSSCNLASPKKAKLPEPKYTELQGGSSASSPSERVEGDAAAAGNALELFPSAPTVVVPEGGGASEPNKVIRVVPHNPRSATASAARIFQSIQEERKQFD